MRKTYNVTAVFFELLRAGLWEKEVGLLPYGEIDFSEVQRLAEEQSVVGLVSAGFEYVKDIKVQKRDVLQFIGQTIQLEQKNQAMNYFIGVLVDKMREAGIYTLLVKGQGVAQCYERPLWRACGDVDFFLNEENYEKAKSFLTPLASKVEYEGGYTHHLGMTIDPWVVELHGSMRCGLSSRIDKVLDEIQQKTFRYGEVRVWNNGETCVYLPKPDNDIHFVFSHFLKHFYIGGIGLRQICDWCRLLWTYRSEIDTDLLASRLRAMRLTSEWKAFGAFAVEYLGMPVQAMPLYSEESKWKRKADKICSFVMEVGNFGNNRDASYFKKYPYLIRKACSLGRRAGDMIRHSCIFPLDSLRFFSRIIKNGVRAAIRGEG